MNFLTKLKFNATTTNYGIIRSSLIQPLKPILLNKSIGQFKIESIAIEKSNTNIGYISKYGIIGNSANINIKDLNSRMNYTTGKPPPPLGRGPITVSSKREAFLIYSTTLLLLAVVSIILYQTYERYKELQQVDKISRDLENISDQDIADFIKSKQESIKILEQVEQTSKNMSSQYVMPPKDRIIK
ncbi:hypothetical protein DLAC_08881 [Tieghemostelium lacteum]|uniref:Uncharacterized protein n=1 Tax=Tieghemostelium lacteum TaxID=361077 RepID=A0A151Z8I2_TIELA|nr:hypothetical protein DLAC_08881 [Tieghemostelium lacteum]|eukprot:KYQ90279.1 hypothetical protein DLAC_08881 [Tieghemostelium lacteum]